MERKSDVGKEQEFIAKTDNLLAKKGAVVDVARNYDNFAGREIQHPDFQNFRRKKERFDNAQKEIFERYGYNKETKQFARSDGDFNNHFRRVQTMYTDMATARQKYTDTSTGKELVEKIALLGSRKNDYGQALQAFSKLPEHQLFADSITSMRQALSEGPSEGPIKRADTEKK
jgi:hypothetical protein